MKKKKESKPSLQRISYQKINVNHSASYIGTIHKYFSHSANIRMQ